MPFKELFVSKWWCWDYAQPWSDGSLCLSRVLLGGSQRWSSINNSGNSREMHVIESETPGQGESESVSRSVVSDSLWPLTTTHQAPLSMGFPRQEYWSGLPLSSPGDLLNPGIKPRPPALQADSLPSEPPDKSQVKVRAGKIHLSEERLCLERCKWWNVGSGWPVSCKEVWACVQRAWICIVTWAVMINTTMTIIVMIMMALTVVPDLVVCALHTSHTFMSHWTS